MAFIQGRDSGFVLAPYTLSDPDAWRGATLYTTYDDGDTWHEVDAIFDQTLHARIDTAPNIGPVTRWDRNNSLTITAINQRTDLLQSVTDLSVLNGQNSAIIGDNYNGWEIISFRDVDQNADSSFTLSCLIRGRRGTEYLVDKPKSLFILLWRPGLLNVPVATDRIGETRYYRLVTNGMFFEDFTSKPFASNGAMIKPFSPVHIKGWRESNGDLKITWIRRTRGNDEGWIASGNVPMLEENEEYEVDIMDGETVVRTFETSGHKSDLDGIIYTDAQQVTDFGSSQSQVTVNIYQMSQVVGRGFPATATI